MADKREQCKSCKMECPENIFQAKLDKGRIPFDKCLDFTQKQTNADRIRAMSDEELAKLITSGDLCAICPFCKYYGTEQCYIENEGVHKNCDSGIMQYLQSEVEE